MNPLKWFWYDLKKDWVTIKRLATEDGFAANRMKRFKSILSFYDMKTAVKESALWIVLLVLAFLVGMFWASQHYQTACNDHIMKEFYPDIWNAWEVSNYTLNSSELSSFMSNVRLLGDPDVG